MNRLKSIVIGLGPKLDVESWRREPLSYHNPLALYREAIARSLSPNLGAIAVSSWLQSHGFEAMYTELALEHGIPLTRNGHELRYEWLAEQLSSEKYTAAFISCMSTSEEQTLFDVVRLIRHILPEAVIVVGGYHASAAADTLIKNDNIDIIVKGDLEPIGEALLNTITCSGVSSTVGDGIISATNGVNSYARVTKGQGIRIDYRVAENYIRFYDMMGTIASRGCVYACSFCQERTMRGYYFCRPVEDVLTEVQKIRLLFESTVRDSRPILFYFLEPLFGLDRGWLLKFCQEVNRRNCLGPWAFQTRVGQLSKEKLSILVDADCSLISIGLESFSPEILLLMGKTRHPESYLGHFYEEIEMITGYGIEAQYNIIYGFPGETSKTLRFTEKCISEMKIKNPDVTVNLNLFRAIPHTPAYNVIGRINGSKHLIPEWWRKPIIPGITVTTLPSKEISVVDLLEFCDRMFQDDFCYRRDGSPDDLEKVLQKDVLVAEDLLALAGTCRKIKGKAEADRQNR